jgi:hypothetical protein
MHLPFGLRHARVRYLQGPTVEGASKLTPAPSGVLLLAGTMHCPKPVEGDETT